MASHTADKQPSNAALKSPSAYQLRALVLDYLGHNCYGATARAFLRESTVEELDADADTDVFGGSTEAAIRDEDAMVQDETSISPSVSTSSAGEVRLSQIEQRRGATISQPMHLLMELKTSSEIRDRILAGEIDEAIDLLNRYFPSVLSSSAPSTSSPTYSAMKKLHQETASTSIYVTPTSVEPSHLLLNLRIQAFSECCRTEPLIVPSSHPPSSPDSSNAKGKLPDTGTAESEVTSQTCRSSSTTPSATTAPSSFMDPAKMAVLIQKTRKLNEIVKALPNPHDREKYKRELTNVASLLAYTKPEKSAVAKYLSWERRVALSDQINRAILDRCGFAPISDIELAARYTTVLWDYAKVHGVKPRAGILMPPRSPMPSRPSLSTITKPDKADKKEAEGEQLPTFDLHSFVHAKRP